MPANSGRLKPFATLMMQPEAEPDLRATHENDSAREPIGRQSSTQMKSEQMDNPQHSQSSSHAPSRGTQQVVPPGQKLFVVLHSAPLSQQSAAVVQLSSRSRHASVQTPPVQVLSPQQSQLSVHVLPVGLECPDTRATVPTLDKREIPVGCTMIVTATPKDKNLNDVDPRLHGDDIKWDMPTGDFRVKIEDFHGQPFNLKLIGKEAGEFAICAEVAKVAGCMLGNVSP